ncbi:MAG: hypothetical protein ACNA8N_04610 [Trueperaceae bacterium]
MRLLVTLLFLGALVVFLWTGLQYLLSRLARPLDEHRREHDQIQDRLDEVERRLGGPVPGHDGRDRGARPPS